MTFINTLMTDVYLGRAFSVEPSAFDQHIIDNYQAYDAAFTKAANGDYSDLGELTAQVPNVDYPASTMALIISELAGVIDLRGSLGRVLEQGIR